MEDLNNFKIFIDKATFYYPALKHYASGVHSTQNVCVNCDRYKEKNLSASF